MKAEAKKTIGELLFWLFVAVTTFLVHTFGLNK